MNFLYNTYNLKVENAYIIHVPTNPVSMDMANRCLQSCEKLNYPATLWQGFDGTGSDLIVPPQVINQGWYRWLKITDHYQSMAEVACSLSHISLWVRCMELDQPIVILEHDAIMVKPYTQHEIYNGIVYLGSVDNLRMPEASKELIPRHSAINRNWNFINRAHAYSIDPAAARRLFTCVLERGIYESADVMIRVDDVAIVQTGFYAYELCGETIIKTRKK